jgi:Family of unknown function (DUF6334)
MICSSYENLVELLDGEKHLTLYKVELWKLRSQSSSGDLLSCKNLEALVLFCGDYEIYVLCDGETDEVIIGDIEIEQATIINLSQQEPWNSALEKELFSVWKLTNQRGYADGLQFEFGFIGQEIRILIDGAASQIRIWTVNTI